MNTYGPEDSMSKYEVTDPDLTSKTSSYYVLPGLFCPEPTARITDPETGLTRKRRYAVVMNVLAVPGYQHIDDPISIGASAMPMHLIDADSIEDLKQRVLAEVEKQFLLIEDVVQGRLGSLKDLLDFDEDEE